MQHECDHLNGTIYVDKMVPRTFRTLENLRLPLPKPCPPQGVFIKKSKWALKIFAPALEVATSVSKSPNPFGKYSALCFYFIVILSNRVYKSLHFHMHMLNWCHCQVDLENTLMCIHIKPRLTPRDLELPRRQQLMCIHFHLSSRLCHWRVHVRFKFEFRLGIVETDEPAVPRYHPRRSKLQPTGNNSGLPQYDKRSVFC